MNIIDQLKIDEGEVKRNGRHVPYKDSLGYLTAGYGRLLERGFSDDEAELMLRNDLRQVEEQVSRFAWFDQLTDARKDVIRNMVFNLGLTKFLKFKNTIKHIQREEYKEAAMEMLNSKWARQVGSRAIRLAKEMEEG